MQPSNTIVSSERSLESTFSHGIEDEDEEEDEEEARDALAFPSSPPKRVVYHCRASGGMSPKGISFAVRLALLLLLNLEEASTEFLEEAAFGGCVGWACRPAATAG